MAEVALVMIFFEWVCSGGFQIVVGSWSWLGFKSAPVMIFFFIGVGLCLFMFVFVFVFEGA